MTERSSNSAELTKIFEALRPPGGVASEDRIFEYVLRLYQMALDQGYDVRTPDNVDIEKFAGWWADEQFDIMGEVGEILGNIADQN